MAIVITFLILWVWAEVDDFCRRVINWVKK